MRSAITRALAILSLSVAALSCASSFQLSPEEEAALREAMAIPLTFVVERSRSYETWDRAQRFVDRYNSMKLRTITDSSYVTYDAPTYTQVPAPVEEGSSIRYGYSVSRTSVPDGIQITVKCVPSSKLGEQAANQNAHIAAHYIRTGSLACDRCIVR